MENNKGKADTQDFNRMVEGYQAIAEEQRELADIFTKIEQK